MKFRITGTHDGLKFFKTGEIVSIESHEENGFRVLNEKGVAWSVWTDSIKTCLSWLSQHYTFEEVKEDNDMKQFTKDDLRSGMVVEIRDGEKFLVIENVETERYGKQDFVIFNESDFAIASSYDSSLKSYSFPKLDIVKVYKTFVHGLKASLLDFNLELIYDADAKNRNPT